MATHGVSIPSALDTPTTFSATQNVSFRIQDGPGLGRTRSMVFGMPATPLTAARTFAPPGPFVETPRGPGTLYRGSLVDVLTGQTRIKQTTTYFNLRLVSDR